MELVTKISAILTILNSKYPRAGLSVSTRGLPKTEGIPNGKKRLLARIPDCSHEVSLNRLVGISRGISDKIQPTLVFYPSIFAYWERHTVLFAGIFHFPSSLPL